jgi:hypothetical protein
LIERVEAISPNRNIPIYRKATEFAERDYFKENFFCGFSKKEHNELI